MKPLVRGSETRLIEIPVSWYLDDLPPMMFIKAAPNSHGFVNPRDIEEMWRTLYDRLLALPQDLVLYPGHDYAKQPPAPLSAVRRTNGALQAPDLATFRRMWRG